MVLQSIVLGGNRTNARHSSQLYTSLYSFITYIGLSACGLKKMFHSTLYTVHQIIGAIKTCSHVPQTLFQLTQDTESLLSLFCTILFPFIENKNKKTYTTEVMYKSKVCKQKSIHAQRYKTKAYLRRAPINNVCFIVLQIDKRKQFSFNLIKIQQHHCQFISLQSVLRENGVMLARRSRAPCSAKRITKESKY